VITTVALVGVVAVFLALALTAYARIFRRRTQRIAVPVAIETEALDVTR
jgi:hypothetical protein